MPSSNVSASTTGLLLEYIGPTALTAFGPVTGARYRFDYPGARLAVHWQDAAALAQVPTLKHASVSAS